MKPKFYPYLALIFSFGITLPFASAPGARTQDPATVKEESSMSIQITSTAFPEGEPIPSRYTCDAEDKSPLLRWTDLPKGTRSIALVCDDPDAPGGNWVHWILFGLPPQITELPEGVPTMGDLPSGARQGKNSFGKIGYGGPCPPKGSAHRYFFNLYALDIEITLEAGATKKELLKAMEGHVLAGGHLMGTYQRK